MLIDDREYLSIRQCAEHMGITVDEIKELVRTRALRAIDLGFEVFVEPAILRGAIHA